MATSPSPSPASPSTLRSRARSYAAVAIGAVVVLAGAVLVAPGQPATGVPGGPTAEFDPLTRGWYSYRDQSSAQFADTFAERKGAYLPIDLDIDTSGSYRVGSIWQRNTSNRGWREKRDLSAGAYQDYWTKAKKDGYRLAEHETYLRDGQRRYAGIWVRNKEDYSWASKRGQSASQLTETETAYRRSGLMPVDVDMYRADGATRYSTVWVEEQYDDWRLVRNLTEAKWESTFDDLSGSYRVLTFTSVQTPSGQRYGGVFVTNDNARGWYFRHGLSAKAYANWWNYYRDLGYRLVAFDRTATADGTRYAGVWRQNSERPTWPLRRSFDDAIADALGDAAGGAGFPGVSVGVYDDGAPVYTRGFGYADVDDQVWMDATHTGNLASISKAIAGVLTFRMIERGELDLDDETRDWVPTMPAQHDHTVGQLLSNRGCVRHYVSGQDGFEGDEFDTALEAAEEFWDDALLCDPATETEYHYSTHGYTLLGAALEAAGDDDVQDLVRKRLTTPYSLGTVGPQLFSGHRWTPYVGGDEVDVPVNDWKVLGGGLDGSAVDLAAFGDKLLRGQILDEDSLEAMWDEPDSTENYAYGWITGTLGGYDMVAKDGLGAGVTTYLLLLPEQGISIAVLANSRGDDGFAARLAEDLGQRMLPQVG